MTGCHMTKFISLPIAISEITSFVQLSYHVFVFHDSFHLQMVVFEDLGADLKKRCVSKFCSCDTTCQLYWATNGDKYKKTNEIEFFYIKQRVSKIICEF